jgi:hypothetical protein
VASELVALDYNLLKLFDKIKKNNLDEIATNFIKIGLTNIKQIKEYFNQQGASFTGKANFAIVSKYNELKKAGTDSNLIFWELVKFCGDVTDFRYMAAAVSIVVYFFEECEVFEK